MLIDTVSALRQVAGPLPNDLMRDMGQTQDFDRLLAQAEAAAGPANGVAAAAQAPDGIQTVEITPT